MGNICNCRKKNKKKIVLLLVGLDNAGKTAAAKGLAGEATDIVIPTVGFSVINLTYLNHIVKVFDLGGGRNIRGIWHRYFVDVHGVIYVVDSSDVSRLDEAKQVLSELLSHEKISSKPILILANKQDNEDALDEVEIIEKLDLEMIVNGNQCPTLVECCSATDTSNLRLDPGIKKGYEWLVNYVIRNYDLLNKRVEEDVALQTKLEQSIRKEQMEKIRLKNLEVCEKVEDVDAIESYSNYERKLNVQMSTSSHAVSIIDGDQSDLSEISSSDSFPPVYHIKEEILLERPKSVVEIVKKQLELNNVISRKSSLILKSSNKTAPLHLYNTNPPKSASSLHGNINQQNHVTNTRNFKSAGHKTIEIVELLPNVPIESDSNNIHRELYQFIQTDQISMQQLGRQEDSLSNSKAQHCNGDSDALSIINVTKASE